MMYRALVLRRLAVSARKMAECEELIAAEQALLEHAIREGLMVTAHTARLRHLQEAQAVHLATRDRLHAELRALDEKPRPSFGAGRHRTAKGARPSQREP